MGHPENGKAAEWRERAWHVWEGQQSWQTPGKGLGHQVGQGKLRTARRSEREVGLRRLSRGEAVGWGHISGPHLGQAGLGWGTQAPACPL